MKQNIHGLKVAMVQMSIANEPYKNAEVFLQKARQAAAQGTDIVVGPEMMLSHYLSGDRYEDSAFVDEMYSAAQYIVSESADISAALVFGGLSYCQDGRLGEDGRIRKYNAAFVVHGGVQVSNNAGQPFAIKTLQPNYRIFDDTRHFYDLRKVAIDQGVAVEELQKPFTVFVNDRQINLGVMICEDMWDSDYTHKPAEHLVKNGADILINVSASPWSWRKNEKRDSIVRTICQTYSVPFVYVNNVGVQNNGKNQVVFDGASTAYDARGAIIAMAKRYQEIVELVEFTTTASALKRSVSSDVAELYTAISQVTKGYLDTLPQSSQRKVVVGVSGGVDSALSLAFFCDLLGPERVIAVNMPYGNFNSKETKGDAALLAKRLGVEYRVIPIDPMVDARCTVTGVTSGSSQHKTVQAIERMNVIAAVAAQEGGFFTCNANWTEIAFGYGTLNGDLRGTFAPWMNCRKRDVYRLATYVNQEVYGREVIPQSIIDRPPMDELTAVGTAKRDDPFDYGTATENGYHDQMVRGIVAFRRSAEWFLECYEYGTLETELQLPGGKLKTLFPTPKSFVDDLERCFNLFHAAVYKRVQSVPGPLVDKRSFGWDFRESVLPWLQTRRYKAIKTAILAGS